MLTAANIHGNEFASLSTLLQIAEKELHQSSVCQLCIGVHQTLTFQVSGFINVHGLYASCVFHRLH